MRVMYEAYVPSYAISYDCLGDRQAFMYKYGWELAVYFGFYVLPFINDLFTNEEFVPFFLRKFGLLGPINRRVAEVPQRFLPVEEDQRRARNDADAQRFLRDDAACAIPSCCFYQVGLTPAEAMDALERQFNSLKGFARWIVAQVHATVLGDQSTRHRKLELRTSIHPMPDTMRSCATSGSIRKRSALARRSRRESALSHWTRTLLPFRRGRGFLPGDGHNRKNPGVAARDLLRERSGAIPRAAASATSTGSMATA